MNKKEIIAALEADPLTVFACKPMQFDVSLVCIRGLRQVPGHGRWSYEEVRCGTSPTWVPDRRGIVASRDIVTVEEAKAILKEREAQTSKRSHEQRQIDALVKRLDRFGVQARRSGQHLAVEDCRALDALLDQLEV